MPPGLGRSCHFPTSPGELCTREEDLNEIKAYELGHEAGQEVGLSTYMVADLRPGLLGLGGAFLALSCDPRSPTMSAPDLGHS
jgi:hypothetical protein